MRIPRISSSILSSVYLIVCMLSTVSYRLYLIVFVCIFVFVSILSSVSLSSSVYFTTFLCVSFTFSSVFLVFSLIVTWFLHCLLACQEQRQVCPPGRRKVHSAIARMSTHLFWFQEILKNRTTASCCTTLAGHNKTTMVSFSLTTVL